MSKESIKLKVITQQKVVFEQETDAIYVQALDGRIGILPNHIPLITGLNIGVTKAIFNNEATYITTMGGILQFKDNIATILTDTAELGSDIDEARAKEAAEKAKAKLLAHTDKVEILRAQMALAKAIARISATRKDI